MYSEIGSNPKTTKTPWLIVYLNWLKMYIRICDWLKLIELINWLNEHVISNQALQFTIILFSTINMKNWSKFHYYLIYNLRYFRISSSRYVVVTVCQVLSVPCVSSTLSSHNTFTFFYCYYISQVSMGVYLDVNLNYMFWCIVNSLADMIRFNYNCK